MYIFKRNYFIYVEARKSITSYLLLFLVLRQYICKDTLYVVSIFRIPVAKIRLMTTTFMHVMFS